MFYVQGVECEFHVFLEPNNHGPIFPSFYQVISGHFFSFFIIDRIKPFVMKIRKERKQTLKTSCCAVPLEKIHLGHIAFY